MQLPDWLQSWKWDQRWQETGFEFLDEAAFLDELALFMDREADFIVFAEAKDLSIPRGIVLAYQPLVKNQIFAVFQGDLSYPLAIPADLDEVRRFSDYYLSPGWQMEQMRLPYQPVPRVWRGTSQRQLTPLTKERLKWSSFYIGAGHYEHEMMDMENSAAFNSFLRTDRMVTATLDGGQWSQWYTGYSGSIFSLYRIPMEDQWGIFYLFVHYRPCPYLEGKRKILSELAARNKPAGKLPEDVPFDVVLALAQFPFHQIYTIEELKEEALNGNYEWFIHLLGYLDCPLVKREIGDLEEVFSDFADCRHEKIRQEVTTLAHLHGWQNLLNQLQKND